MAEGSHGPSLAAAIAEVRAELEQARQTGKGSELQFGVQEVELEFTVNVETSGTGHTGVRLWVVDLGASGGRQQGSENRIRVLLKPTMDGHRLEVGSPQQRRPR